MAPKKGKGKKGKKGKGEGKLPPITNFEPPVIYNSELVSTSIVLLESTEDYIVLQSLAVLAKQAIEREQEFIDLLIRLRVQKKLFHLLYNHNLLIIRFALKLLAQIMRHQQAFDELNLQCTYSIASQLFCIFMKNNDPIIREFVTVVLAIFAKQHQIIVNYIFSDEFVRKIFENLMNDKRADMQLNLLELFFYALEANGACFVTTKCSYFLPQALMCFAVSEVVRIKDMALKVIQKLLNFHDLKLFERFQEVKFYEFLYSNIINDLQEYIRRRLLNLLITLVAFKEPVNYMVKTKEFLGFCQFAMNCSGVYLEEISVVLKRITSFDEHVQLLYDLSVEQAVMSLFRTSNEKVFYNGCECLNNLSVHRYCLDMMAVPLMIDKLMSMLRNHQADIVPYHEQAIKTVLGFVIKNNDAFIYLPTCPSFKYLFDLLGNPVLTADGQTNIVKLIYVYCLRENYKYIVMTPEVYRKIFGLFLEENAYSVVALEILSQFITSNEYRTLFLDLDGPKKFVQRMKATFCDNMFGAMFIFLENILKYRKISDGFLYARLVPLLKLLKSRSPKKIKSIERTLNIIYSFNLPLKFFDLGRLEIEDKIRHRFFLIRGEWNNDFPMLEMLVHQKLCPKPSFYLIDLYSAYDQKELQELFETMRKSAQRSAIEFENVHSEDDNSSEQSLEYFYGIEAQGPSLIKLRPVIKSPEDKTTKVKNLSITNLVRKCDSDISDDFKESSTKKVAVNLNSVEYDSSVTNKKSVEFAEGHYASISAKDSSYRFRTSWWTLIQRSKDDIAEQLESNIKYGIITLINSSLRPTAHTMITQDIQRQNPPKYEKHNTNKTELAKIKIMNIFKALSMETKKAKNNNKNSLQSLNNNNSNSKSNSKENNKGEELEQEQEQQQQQQQQQDQQQNKLRPVIDINEFINEGDISSDGCLPILIEEARLLIYFSPKKFNFIERVAILAKFVYSQLSGPYETESEQHHIFEIHLQSLKKILGTNIIPIGYLRRGEFCERALMFKAIGDQLEIPSTLVKGEKGIYWNEVPVLVNQIEYEEVVGPERMVNFYVVDLVYKIGNLMLVGSNTAQAYCKNMPFLSAKKLEADLQHRKDLQKIRSVEFTEKLHSLF